MVQIADEDAAAFIAHCKDHLDAQWALIEPLDNSALNRAHWRLHYALKQFAVAHGVAVPDAGGGGKPPAPS